MHTLRKFFFTIKQIPQLKVSFIINKFFFNHLKILEGLILLRLISAQSLSGIILFMLSSIPPPVIFAQPLIKFLSIRFSISLT